ncbi:MAG TPA: hypothetical protein VNQ50_04480 [Xanthobacteraceae bacterium]|jgi:hypothetical protein|nr:hypothetical protein [Xanthobacteraceae bacterium]
MSATSKSIAMSIAKSIAMSTLAEPEPLFPEENDPRDDLGDFVRVVDEKTMIVSQRRGSNRIDGLHLVTDPRIAVLA